MRFGFPWFSTCLLFLTYFSVLANPVDSVRTTVTPVQCFGLRNGSIYVDSVFGGDKPFFYSLDGQTFTTNPSFEQLWAGAYTLYVRDASGGAKHWSFLIVEPDELTVRLVASDSNTVRGMPITLRALSSLEPDFLTRIEWRPMALFARQDTLRQTLRLSETTQFVVTLFDQKGCSASTGLEVAVQGPNLFFPNVIKPGSGADANFTVFAGEGVRSVASLQIYSRAGGLVFERTGFQPNAPLQGWGGRWGSKFAPAGVYPWVAVIEFLDGKQVRYEGNVTLVH